MVFVIKKLVKNCCYYLLLLACFACNDKEVEDSAKPKEPYIFVLGNAQDAGYPQIACKKDCCQRTYENLATKRMVSSIAVIDPVSNESWLFDATPDFTQQTKLLSNQLKDAKQLPDGIFLTHGHMGHYTGLMFLGREALSAQKMPVYAMPRMRQYLTQNGPWSQLVTLQNIELRSLQKDSIIKLNERISVQPIEVPHRDEFTETVGFVIHNQEKKALFIPDIDKWHKWERDIAAYVKKVDLAFLDATFFKNGEIDRDMDEVPHPFVEESMQLFETLSAKDKKKIFFIHFNHTNPLLIDESKAQEIVRKKGFNIAKQEMKVSF